MITDTNMVLFSGRPRFEGSNICSWIGFKHVMYLMEESVLEYFHTINFKPGYLYEQYGLCLEIVDSDIKITYALHIDDLITIRLLKMPEIKNNELNMELELLLEKEEKVIKAAEGTVKVLLRKDNQCGDINIPELIPFVHERIDRKPLSIRKSGNINFIQNRGSITKEYEINNLIINENNLIWKWRIPYFYCHFSDVIQHSGYIRLLEEVVDLFLENRGISIRRMLDSRGWIPVVSEVKVEILQEAFMEEEIYIVYEVEDIYKDLLYKARMDCYVIREQSIIHTSSCKIVHGYAKINNRKDWSLVPFDKETLTALKGEE